jgi:C1A family cysteine protease
MPDRRYGWRRDLPDQRDRQFKLERHGVMTASLPASIDLRAGCPPVYDQGDLGSCTANAIAAAMQYDDTIQKLSSVMPSRLFVYFNERSMNNSTASDSGAAIRDSVKAVVQWGVCPETEWPYDPAQFAVEPPKTTYADAGKHLALVYEAVDQDIDSLQGCLAAGFPFVFGFTVHQSFESDETAKTGIVTMPRWFERTVGGHAVMAVGYQDADQMFVVRNSWGPDWGAQGYFFFPYAYMTSKLCSDFWTVRTVE